MNIFCPLASGSRGNSIYLQAGNTKVLIDAGLGFVETKKRLASIDVNIEDIEAIFITHDHLDHISGLKTILSKLDLFVIANVETARGINNSLHISPKYKIFTTDESFKYSKDLSVHPFSIQHDTLDPVGFLIETAIKKIAVCTDLGMATSLVKAHLKKSDILYIEANHIESMLQSSARPAYLKKRIMGRQGHLSNNASFDLIQEVLHSDLKNIYLAHLSPECNSKESLKKQIEQFIIKNSSHKLNIEITHQEKISTPLYF